MKKMKILFVSLLILLSTGMAFGELVWFQDKDHDTYPGKWRKSTPGENEAALVANGWYKSSDPLPAFWDCNENDPSVWKMVKLWVDNDNDGFATGDYDLFCVGSELPTGYVSTEKRKGNTDCDDSDPTVWRNMRLFRDADGDGYAFRREYLLVCIGSEIPFGYTQKFIGYDANDNDASGWRFGYFYKDYDGDFKTVGDRVAVLYNVADPTGYRKHRTAEDCNDNDPLVWQFLQAYRDQDGDGYSIGIGPKYCSLSAPAGFVNEINLKGRNDCDDSDPAVMRKVCVVPVNHAGERTGPNEESCIGLVFPFGYMECSDYKAAAGTGITPAGSAWVTVYPNPAVGFLNISLLASGNDRVEILLIDTYGRVVKEIIASNVVKGQTFTLNTSSLKPGIYRLTIKKGGRVENKTIGIKI